MTPSPPLTAADRDAFLAAVRAAGLFGEPQLARVEAAAGRTETAVGAARALITAGYLTKFQAERLLAGRTDGYHLGPYVILQQIGSGPSARVYKARHRTMNRLVAVKVLSAELTRTAADRDWYRGRVRAAAQLNHPNVVTAYDADELAGRYYLVLEYVDGPDLDALVRERGPLPAAEACELARQAAAGLEHAHALGMAHRDLKPSNVLVARPDPTAPDPLVKLTDFGLARPAPGGPPGAADYAAPEQADHPAADHRADVYALGAVLYFLLAGRPPFPGGAAARRRREEPPRLDLLRSDVAPELDALVRWMLATDPARRPTAAEVREELEAVAGTDTVSFELPAGGYGPYSFAGGMLSDGCPVPMAVPVTEGAAGETARHPVPAGDTSPWEQLDGAAERRRAGRSAWVVGGAAAGLLALTAASVGLLVRVIGR
jgi:serine/threonine-protein kinase